MNEMIKNLFAIALAVLMISAIIFGVIDSKDSRNALQQSNTYLLGKVTLLDKNRGVDMVHFKYLIDTNITYTYASVDNAYNYKIHEFYKVKFAILDGDTVFELLPENKLATTDDVVDFFLMQGIPIKLLEKYNSEQ